MGLAPWWCQRDSVSAEIPVVMEPVHGRVVLSVAIMLRSPATDVFRCVMSIAWVAATVEKSIRILSMRSACRPETLSLSLESVGRQDSHTANIACNSFVLFC